MTPTARSASSARGTLVLLGALVVGAVVLRVLAVDQALYGDELYTHDAVVGRSFASMFHRVEVAEDSPPLFFVFAWIGAKVADPTGWGLRVTSLVAGCATVPLLFVTARRIVGDRTGLIGTALFAFSPFAVFYASEARAYSLMAFFLVASTYALLRAIDSHDLRWWSAFSIATACALYTHYTAAAVVGAQLCWSIASYPRLRRRMFAAAAASALAFLPWLVLGPKPSIAGFQVLFPFTVGNAAKAVAQVGTGHPFEPLHELPGTVGFALLAIGGLATLIAALVYRRSLRVSTGARLFLVTAAATPILAAGYSVVAASIFAPRNLYASLPFACLLAAIAMNLAARLRAVAAIVVIGALLLTAVRSESPSHQRPPFNSVAAALNHRPGRIAVLNLYPIGGEHGRRPLLDSLRIYLDEPRRANEVALGNWHAYDAAAAMSGRFSVVAEQPTGLSGGPPVPPAPRGYRLVRREVFAGFSRIGLFTFIRVP
jgi:4-amino-4-deoxy-L-arabinose transferase-like glycosyltransferase